VSAIPTIDLSKCPRKALTPPSAQAQQKGKLKSRCWALSMGLNFDMMNLEEVEGLEPCSWWNYDFKPVYNPLPHPEAGENYLVTNEEAKTRLSSRLLKRFTDISILKQYHLPFGIPPGSQQSGG
jgi:hypothetical protein